MALTSGIFNSTATETTADGFVRGNKAVDAAFFAKIFSSFFQSGIFLDASGGGFSVSAVQNTGGTGNTMSVSVGTGACHIGGYFAFAEEAETKTFSVSASERTVYYVLRLNTTAGEISALWKTAASGTAAGQITTTDGDTLPVRTGGIYDLVAARIHLGAGVTEIADSDITDLRQDSAFCGIVAGAVTSFDTDAWTRQMRTYLTELQALTTALPSDSVTYFETNKLNTDLSNLDEDCDTTVLEEIMANHTHAAGTIGAGTLSRTVVADTGNDYTTSRLRNIAFASSVPEDGNVIGDGSLLGVYG